MSAAEQGEAINREEAERRLFDLFPATPIMQRTIADSFVRGAIVKERLDRPREWLSNYRENNHGQNRENDDKIATILEAYVRWLDRHTSTDIVAIVRQTVSTHAANLYFERDPSLPEPCTPKEDLTALWAVGWLTVSYPEAARALAQALGYRPIVKDGAS